MQKPNRHIAPIANNRVAKSLKSEGGFCTRTHKPHGRHKVADDNKSQSATSFFTLNIRRKVLLNLSFDQVKALSLLVFMRRYELTHKGVAKDYSVNQIHDASGLHPTTIKKRLKELQDLGLPGSKRQGKYLFLKTRAKNARKNIVVSVPQKSTVKNIENILLSIRLQIKLRQKEFLHNVLSIAKYGLTANAKKATLKQIKHAKRWLREHCNFDWHKRGFVDYGWSFKSIAKYLGTSIAKAFQVVKFSIEKKFIVKHSNFIFKRITSKLDTFFIENTFIFGNYSYKVCSNSYQTTQP